MLNCGLGRKGRRVSDRLDYVQEASSRLRETFSNPDGTSILYGLIMSLSTEDVCSALDLSFEHQTYPERKAVFRKLESDLQGGVLDCHMELCDKLMASIDGLPARRKSSAAGALLDLAILIGDPYNARAFETVCMAPQATVRRRGFNRLRHVDGPLPNCVAKAFEQFGDIEAARLLASKGSALELEGRQAVLEDRLAKQPFFLSRMYMTLGAQDAGSLDRLRSVSPVTYAYVCAKLGLVLDSDFMVALYEGEMFSRASGLVAWCCGQMGLWDALVRIDALAASAPEAALQKYYEDLHSSP